MGAERMGELHAHVAQPAETDHANLLTLGHAPVAHGRIGGDPGAQQRRGSGEIEVGGNAQNEPLIDDDAVGVAAIGHAAEMLVWKVVGEREVRAELLETLPATWAGMVGIDHAADGDEVAGFVLRDGRANLGDTADDLVARDARVDRGHRLAPLVTDLMQIGVADAAEENLDLHVAVGRIAPRDRVGGERRCLTGGGVGFRRVCVLHAFVLYAVTAKDLSCSRLPLGSAPAAGQSRVLPECLSMS